MQQATRKSLIISGIVWCTYLSVLSLGLLWYFPWRGAEAQKAPATYDRENLRKGLRAMKASPDYKDSIFAALDDDSKSEDQELDEMIQSMLAGQRMMSRHNTPQRVVEQPKPESVWFSDNIK